MAYETLASCPNVVFSLCSVSVVPFSLISQPKVYFQYVLFSNFHSVDAYVEV